jgi:PBP1b-binding outer membrane lipoprotein LpoB
MKKITYLLIIIALVTMGCRESVNIDIPENYEKADITGASVFNDQAAAVTASVSIAYVLKEVVIVLGSSQDVTNLKLTLTISPGATVLQPLGTHIQDFSQPRTVQIASPSGTVITEWTIRIFNP